MMTTFTGGPGDDDFQVSDLPGVTTIDGGGGFNTLKSICQRCRTPSLPLAPARTPASSPIRSRAPA